VSFRSRIAAILHASWFGPALIGLAAAVLVSVMLDPAGDYPRTLEGPGLTVDEIFNVQIGVEIADPLLAGDLPKLIKASRLLPDHPPLGRLWLGIAHEMNLLIHPPSGEHGRIVIACARTGSAVAFGLLVFIVGYASALWYGRLAGYGTAVAIVLIPRVFGHAHLAALETILNLTYAAAFLSVACWWKPTNNDSVAHSRPPRFRSIIFCGIIFGLALLTKIQAIFIPAPVVVWALINWRWRAIWPLVLWGLTGLAVFFVGWPWLWLDPQKNFLKFLGQTSDRAVLYVWYLGQQFADRDAPWHYPWIMFAATVPIGLHLLGIWGIRATTRIVQAEMQSGARGRKFWDWLASRESLITGGILCPLVAFSVPRIAVYDGERLFLIVFPLWALFIGRGFVAAHDWLAKRINPFLAGFCVTIFLACQSIGLVQFCPCWLSYYNCSVGGLWGAEKLGFQTTYWGDGLTRDFLVEVANQVPAGSTIDFLPVVHDSQLAVLESQCPAIRAKHLKLRPFDARTVPTAKYLLTFLRRDYWPKEWNGGLGPYRVVLSVQRQNVILASLLERE
jgi:hypothetical protein